MVTKMMKVGFNPVQQSYGKQNVAFGLGPDDKITRDYGDCAANKIKGDTVYGFSGPKAAASEGIIGRVIKAIFNIKK
jgi:hypothetical protein